MIHGSHQGQQIFKKYYLKGRKKEKEGRMIFTGLHISVYDHKGMLWWSDFIYLPIPRP